MILSFTSIVSVLFTFVGGKMTKNKIVERIEVDQESLFYQEHLARYHFAEPHVRSGWVLDIATGTGYGAKLLSQQDQVYVVGGDIDEISLRKARGAYPESNISFLVVDGTHLPFRSHQFQTITTMETIEHIPDDRSYLAELGRVLQPSGVCVITTPNREFSEHHHRVNPYHVREYVEAEFLALLKTYFSGVRLFYQGFSGRYRDQTQQYAEAIQSDKAKLNPILQFGINRIYRPVKRYVPDSVTNFFVHQLLGRTYPQPKTNDIEISDRPMEDFNVFIAVCTQPHQA
jgi:ubiquinone/menaquinone biosynthesis C-methylase UbiE